MAVRIIHHARRRWLKLDAAWPWTDELVGYYETLTTIRAATG